MTPADACLTAEDLTLRYEKRVISENLSVSIPRGKFTAVIGPNACGKSTLLKAFSRVLPPASGRVLLDGKDLTKIGAKPLARQLALLPQSPLVPDGIKVRDLVGRGRFPHQSFLRQWSRHDADAVDEAMAATSVTELADRFVSELSGGQRQRVWLAMVLAQQTPTLLLDEPTTFLDIANQYEVMEICAQLNREGKTIVAVLHDLNQAARYADHLVVLRDGAVLATGSPAEILTSELIRDVFGIDSRVVTDPETSSPMAIPRAQPLARLTGQPS